MNGCVVASGCCMPSAADEEWHSTKRPYSTAAVHHYRAKYHFRKQLPKVYFLEYEVGPLRNPTFC